MAGKGTLSPHQTPQYGDKIALERLGSNTETPMTGVPTGRPGAGRPAEGQGVPAGVGQAATMSTGRGMATRLAKAVKALMYFQAVNAALDDEATRMYLADAKREVIAASMEGKTGTPDWDLD